MPVTATIRSILRGATVFLVLISAAPRVHAETPSRRTVILLTDDASLFEMERLAKAIDAHLSDLFASVLLRTLEASPERASHRLDTATQLLSISTTLCVIWLCPATNELLLLVFDHDEEDLMTHPVELSSHDLGSHFDAIASVVRAALIPYLAPEDTGEAPNAPVSNASTQPPPPTLAKDGNRGPSPASKGLTLTPRLKASAGYTLVDINLGGPFANGATVAIGMTLFTHLELDVQYRILQSFPLNIDEAGIRLHRYPLVVTTGMYTSFGAMVLGISAGIVIDFVRVEGVPPEDARNTERQVRPGLSISIFLRYRVWRWFHINMALETDIYKEDHRYMWNNEQVFVNGKIQPSATVGVSIIWPRVSEPVQ